MRNTSEPFEDCTCELRYSIQPHGDGYGAFALYYGRCDHRHGYNLAYVTDPSFNCDLSHIERLINLGNKEYNKNLTGGHLAE